MEEHHPEVVVGEEVRRLGEVAEEEGVDHHLAAVEEVVCRQGREVAEEEEDLHLLAELEHQADLVAKAQAALEVWTAILLRILWLLATALFAPLPATAWPRSLVSP